MIEEPKARKFSYNKDLPIIQIFHDGQLEFEYYDKKIPHVDDEVGHNKGWYRATSVERVSGIYKINCDKIKRPIGVKK